MIVEGRPAVIEALEKVLFELNDDPIEVAVIRVQPIIMANFPLKTGEQDLVDEILWEGIQVSSHRLPVPQAVLKWAEEGSDAAIRARQIHLKNRLVLEELMR